MNKITGKQHYLFCDLHKYYWAFCIALIFIFTATLGNATVNNHELQIDFYFDTQAIPDKQVSGYRLYKEGASVCDTDFAEPQSIACTVPAEDGTYAFTLSSLYDDGSESPQSAPFLFTIELKGDINGDGTIDLKDAITGLQVLMNFRPDNVTTTGDISGDGKIGLSEVIYCLKKA